MGEVEKGEKNKDCIFCKISKGEIPSEKVFDDENFFGILDINPKAEGHTLIISKKHYGTILDMPCTLGNEFIDAVKKVSLNLINKKKGEGVNVAVNVGEASGQIVHHFHMHIVPRKKGDGLKAIA